MLGRKIAWALPLVLSLVVLLPPTAAHPTSPAPVAALAPVVPATVPHPIWGTVVNCTSTITCTYLFNTSTGKGWANSTVSFPSTKQMALQLPGEGLASYGLAYNPYIALLTGTYTYWTIGNFVGTDVNTGKVVYGTTNTNYTITCHGHSGRGGGCTYTYTTDNGTIEVRFTNAEITSTAISCSPTTTHPGGKVSCTVTVTNGWNASNYPTGKVHLSSARTGSFNPSATCTLSSGTCSFTFHPYDNTCGWVVLLATYPGSATYYKSAGSLLIAVIVSGGC